MVTAVFTIAQVGPHSSVQDGGRRGLMRFGVPASGPMDRAACTAANVALGNPPDAPALEVSIGGLALDCVEGAITLAVAGGGFQVAIGVVRTAPWTVATISAGSRLTIRPGASGSWCYLAFAGTLRARRWLSSASTHELSGFGGGMLTPGARIVVDGADLREDREGEIRQPASVDPSTAIRVVLGPQDRFFPAEAIDTLLSQPFALTDAYDRMGVRLSGPRLGVNAALDMPSEAVARGSEQVAGDGVATVLLADHQTTGGYPKIATVISADFDRFAQLRSRNSVRFACVTPAAAIGAARRRHEDLGSYLASIATPAGSLAERLHAANLIGGVVDGR